MGKKMAPATKNPHKPAPKQVNMCVNHASTLAITIAMPNKPSSILFLQFGAKFCILNHQLAPCTVNDIRIV